MRNLSGLTILVVVAACAPSTPPAPPTPREVVIIKAPFAKTWNAAIDEFAASNIPIKNIDRSSGFISTDPLGVATVGALNYADCGTAIGMRLRTDRATYNVVIRGDSSSTTLKATVRFTVGGAPGIGSERFTECTSSGYWEKGFEERIKARAEGRLPPL